MHTILFYDLVDDYERRRTMFRDEHLTLAREAHARGEIVLAGALAGPPTEQWWYFAAILRKSRSLSPKPTPTSETAWSPRGGLESGIR